MLYLLLITKRDYSGLLSRYHTAADSTGTRRYADREAGAGESLAASERRAVRLYLPMQKRSKMWRSRSSEVRRPVTS